ncbi:hypothetical protein F5X68DRAFT_247059 [Plectosphaerella plurivora]|uniref:Uncharacterized protein n=1 Tax=Plectosphaerella plurivora TaxID=936078 RepID=A0A9P8V3T6_9PEZI|nr:hypothetical protein F5X68DRAFT_247059 [Plectosphaerella plurivora]
MTDTSEDISRLLAAYPLFEMGVQNGVPDNSRILQFVVGEDEEIFLVRQSMVRGIPFFDMVYKYSHTFVELDHVRVGVFKAFMSYQKHKDLRDILFEVEAATLKLDADGYNHGFTMYLVTLAKLIVFYDMYDVPRLGDHLAWVLAVTCFPHTINVRTFGALWQAPKIFKYIKRNVLPSHPVMVEMKYRIRNFEIQYQHLIDLEDDDRNQLQYVSSEQPEDEDSEQSEYEDNDSEVPEDEDNEQPEYPAAKRQKME